MKKRTVILASLCAIFLVIAVVQQLLSLKNPVKTVTFSENPDKITVFGHGLDIVLEKKGDDWFSGDYKALPNTVELISKYLKEIKILEVVGKTGNSIIEEKYDLNDERVVTAFAFKGDKVLRKVKIGKKTSTGSQSYVTIDDSDKIYLVQGDYQGTVAKTESDLVSKKIYSVPLESISSVDFTFPNSKWGFSKNQEESEGSPSWLPSGKALDFSVNDEKVDQWIASISYLDCESFIDDDTILPTTADAVCKIVSGNKEISVSIYKFKTDDYEYVGVSSENPHKFAVSKYVSEKFIKNLDTLK